MSDLNFDRRAVLKATATAAAAGAGAAALAEPAGAASRYFRHGVASGDPLPNRVVIWTRVTPTPQARPGSGRGPAVRVAWQVASDRRFRRIVREGSFKTGPGRDHTVKVDVGGLRPGRAYYYRFLFKGQPSRIGRTKTAPPRGSHPENLRFGVVSCANFQAGWFTAYRHLARRDDLDAILHLGDYLYEYGVGEYGYGKDNVDVRKHAPRHEMVTLTDYRQRHAQYKLDGDLQDLHAKYPFITTWDDHEVTNDRWKAGAENHNPGEGKYLPRQAWAYRAYDEWMPIRLSDTAALGDGSRIYRRLQFGQLAELTLLDLRTYRDEQVSPTLPTPIGPTISPDLADPDRTITGAAQMRFAKESLDNARAQWKLIGNPVMIAPVYYATLPVLMQEAIGKVTGANVPEGLAFNPDQWDGYTADRRELLDHIADHGVRDAVFLTGDIHSAWACDLPRDPATYPLADSSVAVEFVCTSITSNNLKDIIGAPRRTASLVVEETIQLANRHVKYLNFDDHGYSVLDLTSERAQMDYFIIGDRQDPNAGITWTRSYQTKSTTAKVNGASKPVGA